MEYSLSFLFWKHPLAFVLLCKLGLMLMPCLHHGIHDADTAFTLFNNELSLEESKFESVLHSHGAHDTTTKCLCNQSVKEVLHLLLIKEDDLTNWKPDSYLLAIEYNILCHLRTDVHIHKSNNDTLEI
jgi:hypothetical protein